MRHSDRNRKFGREIDARRALLKGLAVALIECGRIKTTEAKAKSLRPVVEKLVTKARRGDLFSQRLVFSYLSAPIAAAKLIREIAPRYAGRPGGYTRINKLPPRSSDGSRMAMIEFV